MEGDLVVGKRKGMSNFFRQFSTHLDLSAKKYKIQESLFGVFKWGDFQPLPNIDYVLIFRQLFAKCESCSVEEFENSRNSFYQVSLVHHKTRRIVVHETRNKAEAFELAKALASNLNKRLLDSATDRRQSTWMKLYPAEHQ